MKQPPLKSSELSLELVSLLSSDAGAAVPIPDGSTIIPLAMPSASPNPPSFKVRVTDFWLRLKLAYSEKSDLQEK